MNCCIICNLLLYLQWNVLIVSFSHLFLYFLLYKLDLCFTCGIWYRLNKIRNLWLIFLAVLILLWYCRFCSFCTVADWDSMCRVVTQTRGGCSNRRSSFWNSRLSFWFSLKFSKARPSVWKTWLSFEKLGWEFEARLCRDEDIPLHKKFSIKDFFSKCDQILRKLWIWSQLLKKSLMENLIFCAVFLKALKSNFNLIINIWTSKKGREKGKQFKLKGKFQHWRKISETLLQGQGFY